MKLYNTDRESQRVSALRDEYRRKGYEVSMPSKTSEIPSFLRDLNYLPDLIATSAEENLVIEVKSRETAKSLEYLSTVAELVNARAGWKFVLVFTNPRASATSPDHFSFERVSELLAKSDDMGATSEAHVEASFLFAWSALEVTLRALLSASRRASAKGAVSTLVRDATIEGWLAREDAHLLDRFYKVRNSILHAGTEGPPRKSDVSSLRRIVKDLFEQAQLL